MLTIKMKRVEYGVFFGLVWLLGGCATPMSDTPAVLVKSAQFEIFSTMSAEKTKALALELERFDALIYATTNAPRVPPVVPTRIFAFERRIEYAKYGPSQTRGVFTSTMRDNRIVIADYSSSISATEVMLHEYVHFVLRNGATKSYPLWYDEGFAEFLSTAQSYKEDHIALGAFPKARLSAFQNVKWVPLRRVIAASTYDDLKGRDKFMLYPESWALVHYLFLDREKTSRPVAQEIADYLGQVGSGTTPHVAFEAAFGETTDSASAKIQKILKNGDLRVIAVPVSSLEYDESEPSVRLLNKGEVALRLGELSLAKGKFEDAENEFRTAIAGNPNDSRAFVGLGDALKFQGRYEEAEKEFDRALEIDADNALNQLDYAEFLEHVARETEYGEKRSALFAQARAAYERSHELDDSIPETLAMHGGTYAAPGEKAALGYPMVLKALKMMPANPMLLGKMAESALAIDREYEARDWLARQFATSAGGGAEKEIAKGLEALKEARAKEEAIAEGQAPDA